MKKRNKLWIAIGIGAFIFIVIMLVSAVLETGERLRQISKYIEYGFYVLSIILFYVLILNPLRIIIFSPSFSIVTILDEENKHNNRLYKKISQTLIESEITTNEEKVALQSAETTSELLEELKKVFNGSVKKDINKIIRKTAKTVLISTAICQNGKLDMVTVLSMNIKMIKEIVLKCGYRPSYAKLSKLIVNVLATSLIAESLEGLDFNELFPQTTINSLSEIPLIKPIASSFVNGITNALMTIRIGIVTRKYLYTDGKLTKSQIRISAIKESIQVLPNVIKEVLAFIPSKISKIFSKKDKDIVADEL